MTMPLPDPAPARFHVGVPTIRVGGPDWLIAGIDARELAQRLGAADVSHVVVEDLALIVDELCCCYSTTPPAALLSLLRPYRRGIGRLLRRGAILQRRRELMVLGGWLSLLAACLHVDLGQRRACMAACEDAQSLARETEHPELAAWAFEVRAWQALLRGDYHQAISLCQAGQHVAGVHTSAAVQLTVQEARAWARVGNTGQTHSTLRRAAANLEHRPASARPDNHFVFDPHKLTSFRASTLAFLGADEEAEAFAHEVIRAHEERRTHKLPSRRVATAYLDLALIATRQDRPEQACRLGGLALETSHRVAPNVWRASEFDEILVQRNGNLPEVQRYHEKYLAFRHMVAKTASYPSCAVPGGRAGGLALGL